MGITTLAVLTITAFLLGYLIVALLCPEKF